MPSTACPASSREVSVSASRSRALSRRNPASSCAMSRCPPWISRPRDGCSICGWRSSGQREWRISSFPTTWQWSATSAITKDPEHPYTQRLLLAAPVAHPLQQEKRRAERRRLLELHNEQDVQASF